MNTVSAVSNVTAGPRPDVHHLQLQLRAVEGAVVRVLGLVERRGFRLLACEAEEVRDGGQPLSLRVRSERSPELLKRQLERLHDVLQVELKHPGVRHHA